MHLNAKSVGNTAQLGGSTFIKEETRKILFDSNPFT